MLGVGEYGNFLPHKYSFIPYNHSDANSFYPTSPAEVKKLGMKWDEEGFRPYAGKGGVKSGNLPDSIEGVSDDILNRVILCEKTGRGFKIIKQELDLYRKLDVPLPHLHPDERFKVRFAPFRNTALYDRNCMKCGGSIKTTYAPERPEKIYCKSCWEKYLTKS